MNRIYKRTRIINGEKYVDYSCNGKDWHGYDCEAIRDIYKRQGDLYEELFGVDFHQSQAMGWYPEFNNFNTYCGGWKKFLKDKGIYKVEKTEIIEAIPLVEFIKEKMDNYTEEEENEEEEEGEENG